METEIVIFDIKEEEQTKEEKELEYKNVLKNSAIDEYHVENIYSVEPIRRPESNILSILCKWVLDYCIPVIDTDSATKLFSISVQTETPIEGRLLQPRKPAGGHNEIYNVLAKNLTSYFNLYLDHTIVSIPANQQFNVVGIVIPSNIHKRYNKNTITFYEKVGLEEIMKVGLYGNKNENDSYLFEEFAEVAPLYPTDKVILFETEAKTKELLSDTIDFIIFLHEYYRSNQLALDLKIETAVESRKPGTTYTPYTYETQTDKVINLLQEVTDVPLTKINDAINSYQLLERENLLKLYNIGKVLGQDNEYFKKYFNEVKVKYKERKEIWVDQVQQNKKRLEFIKKQTIALNKFGTYSNLDENQKKAVENEYKKIESTLYGTVDPNFKELNTLFIRLRKSFEYNQEDKIKPILESIKKLLPDKYAYDEILHGSLCPHVLKHAEVLLENLNDIDSANKVAKALIEDYSLPKDTSGYFCKLCGELLSEADNEDFSFLMAQNMGYSNTSIEDELQIMIWKEASYVITTYIKFKIKAPIKKMISVIASTLRSIIHEEELKLLKRRTISTEYIKYALNLYACIYIMAILCSMMINNPGKVVFAKTDKKGGIVTKTRQTRTYFRRSRAKVIDRYPNDFFETSSDESFEGEMSTSTSEDTGEVSGGEAKDSIKLYEKAVLTNAINLILTIKNTTINKLKVLTSEIIKEIFLKQAYVWAKKYIQPLETEKYEIKDELHRAVCDNIIYQYIYYINNIGKKSLGDANDLEALLGIDLKKIKENIEVGKDMFEGIKIPPAWFGKEGSETDKYEYDSFLQILQFSQDMVYAKVAIPKSSAVDTYDKKWENLLRTDMKMLNQYKKVHITPTFRILISKDIRINRKDFLPENINLANHYCPDGVLHKVNKYLYSNGEEYDAKTIIGWLKDGDKVNIDKFRQLTIVDYKCGKCGNYILKKDNSKSYSDIQNQFEKINDMTAFYRYYEDRCPEGDLHNIVDNICKKCQLDTVAKDKKPYYDKYIDKYKAIEQEKLQINIDILKKIEEGNIRAEKAAKEKKAPLKEYKVSMQSISEWAQFTEMKYNVLINIGLNSNIPYEDIEKGKINPSKELDEEKVTVRIHRSRQYIFHVIQDYNIMKLRDKIVDLPKPIKELLEKYKKQDIDLPTLDKFEDKIDEYDSISYSHYLIETLAKMVLNIYKNASDRNKNVCKDIVYYLTNYIIEQEKLFSKPLSIYLKMMDNENYSDSESDVTEDQITEDIATASSHDEFSDDLALENDDPIVNDIDYSELDMEDPDELNEA